MSNEAPSIFVSVAEQSADEHAGAFVRAFRGLRPPTTFEGLAGPSLRAAGCTTFHDMTAHAAMGGAAFGRIPEALGLLKRLEKWLNERQFDAAVLVDSPTLNLPIAKLLRRRRIPVLYYIAPQTWAWAPWRNRRIRERVDKLACIWPFEESYFQGFGIPATYVGHPSFDHLIANPPDERSIVEMRGDANPLITLLPGSRKHVVESVLPGQLKTANSLQTRFKRVGFLLVLANPGLRGLVEARIASMRPKPVIRIVDADQRSAAIRAADLVLVASGTVTLEVAFHGTPMIVMYNASRWLYRFVGRWVISTPFLSIPNILAGREIVPEFMPYYRTVDPIIARACELLATPNSLERVRRDLKSAIQPIVRGGAAVNAATELLALLDRPNGTSPL